MIGRRFVCLAASRSAAREASFSSLPFAVSDLPSVVRQLKQLPPNAQR